MAFRLPLGNKKINYNTYNYTPQQRQAIENKSKKAIRKDEAYRLRNPDMH